jgi:hypothetical protein
MNKKHVTMIASFAVTAAIVATASLPVFAQAASVTSIGTALATRIATITKRADQEILRRVTALNALGTRINAIERLSAADKGDLSSAIQSQIAAMNALQTQISTDAAANDTSSLKTDVRSITFSYRIFALILPQGTIEAASDRVLTIVGIMNDLGTKFSMRISVAQSAGNTVAAATAALADLNSKVSDADAQAQAAASEVASLEPDNGNKTIMAANTAALKDARSKIQTAQKDLVAARTDALTIIKLLAAFKAPAAANATTSTSTSTP